MGQPANMLPDEPAIAAITLAELAAGPHATKDELERVRRQDRLQWASATWDPLANGLPLYTRNASDFVGLDQILTVINL